MGVIIPNPTVETEDGSVSVSNVKAIEVTNGDLTDDGGRVVSINTAGTDTSPGGADTQVQINDAGSFGASDELSFDANLLTVENAIDLGATGAGGRVQCSQNNQTLLIQHTGGSGAVEVKNMTTDTDTNLKVVGPGSGDANIVMSSTSGAGGITFPDSTTQTTAATGGWSPTAALYTFIQEEGGDNTRMFQMSPIDSDVPSDDLAETTTAGSDSVFIGGYCASKLTSSSQNVFIGAYAGANTTWGGKHVYIGHEAGRYNNSGGYHTFVGHRAGVGSGVGKKGDFNVCLGYEAGESIGNQDGNVVIGPKQDLSTTSVDNEVVIGTWAEFGVQGMKHLVSDSTGACFQGDNETAWSTTSDQVLKRNIRNLADGSLGILNDVQIREFEYKDKASKVMEDNPDHPDGESWTGEWDGDNIYGLDPDVTRLGVIAQELELILPEMVKENSREHKTVDPSRFTWHLIKAIQELTARVEELEVTD
jgi:hypothetical protein